jgi:Tol biopolymer transport system component
MVTTHRVRRVFEALCRRAFVTVLAAAATVSLPVAAAAQDQETRTAWDVTQARGETRTIAFSTDEGTALSIDVSPDGRWIVFDLLGHIWRLPSTGGVAESLTQNSGVAVNYHPRFSPDGRRIAFISDRRGQTNLWVMDADGGEPRAVHTDDNARALTPAWTPDGLYIIVRREPLGGGGGGGGGGLWMHHVDGGPGVRVLDDNAAHWPSVSADGRFIYYHVRSGSNALAGDYQVRRLELRTGEVSAITAGRAQGAAAGRASSGGAFAPEISPDGRWLAFARQLPDATVSFRGHRFGPRTALWLRDLESGAERIIADPIEIAIESGSKSLRILPGYAWTSDGRSIVLSQGGRVRRLDVASGEIETIPFQANVERTISGMAYRAFRIEDGPFTARFLRWPTASPDARRLAFQAVGRIWIQDLPVGTPRRLTPAGFGAENPAAGHAGLQEFSPAWSPDGRWIAFTTWEDTLGGHVWRVPAGGGTPQRITREPGEFVHIAWSRDGRELVAARGAGATRSGGTITQNAWWDVVRIGVEGGDVSRVARVATPVDANPSGQARRAILQPSWGPDGRIFFPAFRRSGNQNVTALVSVARDGGDERTHLHIPNADEAVPSPDGRWVAFQEGDNVFVTAMAYSGTGRDTLTVDKRRGRFPVRALSLAGGLFPRWRDSVTIEFGSGPHYFAYNMNSETADTVSVSLQVPRRIPEGSLALTNARIITLGSDSVIERGTVLVRGARIACVGQCDVAAADTVVDATGRTIVPGFVDMHAHHYREHRGHRPLRDYENAMYLAYGVTTNLDNSMWSQNIFPTAELIEAGRSIGPRAFSSGDPLYRGDAARQNELSSREVAEQNIDRLQSWGAVSIKQYQQPRRNQRQWVSDVARDRGIMVTAESGDIFYNLTMVMDGQTAFEHPFSEIPLYGDVAKFLGRAGFYYSPTLVVAGPGPWNIEYWFAESDVWRDEKQRLWMPWRHNAGHLRRRTLRPDTDYSFPLLAQGMADIIAEGGYGAIGGHGEHHGLAPHWEIWMAAPALGNYGALEVASLHGARFLGAHEDVGSIEVGKLADLLVLDRNPLEDIRATADIRYVMKGGILHDGMTLDEYWPQRRPFGPHYWVNADALRNDDRPIR